MLRTAADLLTPPELGVRVISHYKIKRFFPKLAQNHANQLPIQYEVVYRESILRGGVRDCFQGPNRNVAFYRSDSFTNRSDNFFSTG